MELGSASRPRSRKSNLFRRRGGPASCTRRRALGPMLWNHFSGNTNPRQPNDGVCCSFILFCFIALRFYCFHPSSTRSLSDSLAGWYHPPEDHDQDLIATPHPPPLSRLCADRSAMYDFYCQARDSLDEAGRSDPEHRPLSMQFGTERGSLGIPSKDPRMFQANLLNPSYP